MRTDISAVTITTPRRRVGLLGRVAWQGGSRAAAPQDNWNTAADAIYNTLVDSHDDRAATEARLNSMWT
jgi:hypothetical protein